MIETTGSLRGTLRGSTPRLLHAFDKYISAGGWGVEPHTALQQRPPNVKQISAKDIVNEDANISSDPKPNRALKDSF